MHNRLIHLAVEFIKDGKTYNEFIENKIAAGSSEDELRRIWNDALGHAWIMLKVGEVEMTKLIFDDWSWRCENCKSMMALPGIVPDLQMLKDKGWKYCPVCGKKIDFKATEANKPVFENGCLISGIRMFKEFPPSKEDELREKVKCFKVVRETYWEESKRFLETHTMNHPLHKLSWEDEMEYDKITSIVKVLGDKIKQMEDELE